MCCKTPKGFDCALGIDDIFTDSICSPGTPATIAASNSTEKRKPEDYQRIFWGFNIP